MKVLNIFAGLGGNRYLWEDVEVTAIEKNLIIAQLYQKRFPKDQVLIRNAFDILRNKQFELDYDFIWASPPCKTHSQMQKFNPSKTRRTPIPRMEEIYGLLIWLEWNYKGHYIIENVQPYYKTPILPTARVDRHIFWANFPIRSITFRKPEWIHGQIGGNMRTSQNELIEEYQLEDIKTELDELPPHLRKTLIRNCVDPRIGKHVLEELKQNINQETLDVWLNA